MAPGQRAAASAEDMTSNVHGATSAKPKKPNTRHAAEASHTRTPMLVWLRRIERNPLAIMNEATRWKFEVLATFAKHKDEATAGAKVADVR